MLSTGKSMRIQNWQSTCFIDPDDQLLFSTFCDIHIIPEDVTVYPVLNRSGYFFVVMHILVLAITFQVNVIPICPPVINTIHLSNCKMQIAATAVITSIIQILSINPRPTTVGKGNLCYFITNRLRWHIIENPNRLNISALIPAPVTYGPDNLMITFRQIQLFLLTKS